MIKLSTVPVHRFLAAGVSITAIVLPAVANADVVYVREGRATPDDVSRYSLEVEPHFSFGAENVYGATGFGGGIRLGIPLVAGHLGYLPDNLALSFGGDILHYDNCYYADYCNANYLFFPVAAQWNIFVARRVSLFGEGGAFVYKGWFDGCGPQDGPGCSAPSNFGVLPTFAIGLRIHIGSFTALTLRLGYPTSTAGLSFL
jgi:hypothetical protein